MGPQQLRLDIIHDGEEESTLEEEDEAELDATRSQPDQKALAWTGTPLDFAKAALNTGQAVLEQIGLETYLERWGYPFPSVQLETLRAAVQRAESAG